MSWVALDDFAQFGIAGAATVAFGDTQGGVLGQTDQRLNHSEGAGGQDNLWFGLCVPRGTVESIYKGEALFSSGVARTTYDGLPSAVEIWGGILDATTALSYKIDGYIDKCRLSCGGVGEAVQVAYDIVGTTMTAITATAGQIATPSTTAPFVWAAGAVTIDGAARACQSFEIELQNNLKPGSSLDVKTTNKRRLPEIIEPGNEVVSARFVVKVPITFWGAADTPSLPFTGTIQIGNGYTTKTLTLRALYITEEPVRLERGDTTHTFELAAESAHNALKSASTAAWSVA